MWFVNTLRLMIPFSFCHLTKWKHFFGYFAPEQGHGSVSVDDVRAGRSRPARNTIPGRPVPLWQVLVAVFLVHKVHLQMRQAAWANLFFSLLHFTSHYHTSLVEQSI